MGERDEDAQERQREGLRDLPSDPVNGPLAHAEPGVLYGPMRAGGSMPALGRCVLPKWTTTVSPPDGEGQTQ